MFKFVFYDGNLMMKLFFFLIIGILLKSNSFHMPIYKIKNYKHIGSK